MKTKPGMSSPALTEEYIKRIAEEVYFRLESERRLVTFAGTSKHYQSLLNAAVDEALKKAAEDEQQTTENKNDEN